MDDADNTQVPRDADGLSRRDFSALTMAAGLVATASAAQAAQGVVETAVAFKTPDGTCDAALYHPQGAGHWPAVLLFPDAYGLRPAVRDMGRSLAADGYVVLAINQFYRSGKAPGVVSDLDMGSPDGREKFTALRAPLTPAATVSDATAAFAFLDVQKVVNTKAKAGVQGYCMGGAMAVRTAAALPSRIEAAASFHGGGMVTDKPDSPHLLAPKIKGSLLVLIADGDDKKEPLVKDQLKAALDAAHVPAKVEVYKGAEHGWTMADRPVYNREAAERGWSELLALYKSALV